MYYYIGRKQGSFMYLLIPIVLFGGIAYLLVIAAQDAIYDTIEAGLNWLEDKASPPR